MRAAPPFEALQLQACRGESRFALFHAAHTLPGGAARGQVVYVHPFAEEMNKSRRMAALQARRLAAAGFDVLQPDLRGCGDSDGELSDTRWSDWMDDIAGAASWLRQRRAAGTDAPLCLWGLRAGALLACEAARSRATQIGPCQFLFWQPSMQGRQVLQQFLRLATAGQWARPGATAGSSPTLEALRRTLAQGQAVDIAGYTLPADLAQGLSQATLAPPPPLDPEGGDLAWLEVAPTLDDPTGGAAAPALLPASDAGVSQWQAAGYRVFTQAVTGPSFWQSVEIEEAPGLLEATTQAMQAMQARVGAS